MVGAGRREIVIWGLGGLLGSSDCGRDEDGENLVGCFPGRTSLDMIVHCCSVDLC
jgi:hypothetical protein